MISQFNQVFLSHGACKKSALYPTTPFVFAGIRLLRSSDHAPLDRVSLTVSSSQSPVSLGAIRVSRAARTDAQAALFEYLHSTRGFQFTDAEHISKNSPHFLEDLLSKVKNEQDVLRALSKFFRYHPINEFEPFLESLGLKPSELTLLLPRNLIFLCDDHVMLYNYQVLCDFGVPRTKIGKMYKEANEIFGYDNGILAMKLEAYEVLGLCKSTVIKLVTCCPSLLVGGVNTEFVCVFGKLKELGFGNDWIGGYLSYKNTYNWRKILDTITFLTEVGYSDMQLGIVFKMNPAVFFEGSGKRIYVLTSRLLKLGLKMDEVCSLFSKSPQILSTKCANNLWNAVCFMLDIGMEPKDITSIISTHSQLLGSYSLKGPKIVLRNINGDRLVLCQTIKEDPMKLFGVASESNVNNAFQSTAAQDPGKFLEKTKFLLRLGYVENSDEMTKALKKFRGRGDQLQARFDCLVKAGLDCNVVSGMIKQAPSILNQTRDVIEKKIDYLRNCLGYPLESIVPFPSYLCYDVSRINLRFSMYAWLRKKGVVKHSLSLGTILACSDKRFVKYFVDRHLQGPFVWENLKKSLNSQ